MMYSYPFGHMNPYFPRFNAYRGHSFHHDANNYNNDVNSSTLNNSGQASTNNSEARFSINDNYNNKKPLHNSEDDCTPVFNFLGLKVHFDDLLLIALIYFLYTEDVHDPELFIALILLLMS